MNFNFRHKKNEIAWKYWQKIKVKIKMEKMAEIAEVVLIYCDVVNNSYQHTSKVFCPFVWDRVFAQLINAYHILAREFLFIEIWFNDQNSKPFKIKDKVNMTLMISWNHNKLCVIQYNPDTKNLKYVTFYFLQKTLVTNMVKKLKDNSTKTWMTLQKLLLK